MLKDLVEKLLDEVDSDMKEVMMADEREGMDGKNWQMLVDPMMTILKWQELRDKNKGRRRQNS